MSGNPATGRDLLYRALAEFVEQSSDERRARKRRWRTMVAMVAAYMAFNVGWMFYTHQAKAAPTKNYAAVVRIDGPIAIGKMASTSVLFPVLDEAFADSDAGCVALVINSPGGMVGQSQMLHDRIRALAERNHRKVIAVGEDMMASGGYMIASSAQWIAAPSTAAVGSIGVRQDGWDFTGVTERFGIKDRVFTAGSMKDPVNPWRPVSPEAQAKVEHDLAVIHGEFIRMVKAARGDRISLPDAEIFNGEVFTGADGVKNGLIDATMDLDAAIKAQCGADSYVTYEPHLGLTDALRFLSR